MKKNDILSGLVTSYGSEGEGIIKIDNYTVFVPFTIVGEKVRFHVLKVNKNIAFAKAVEILTPAEGRVRVKCPVFGKCGGCQLMHMDYSSQLNFKHDLIKNCFRKIAFLNVEPHKTIASINKLNYRNKLQLPIRKVNGECKIGFFALNSHRVVEIDDCIIHGEWCKNVISSLKKYIEDKHIEPYDELTGSGDLRHIIVKKAGNEFIVVLVVNGETLKDVNYFEKLLKSSLDGEFSLFLNINTRRDNVIVTDEYRYISGKGTISDSYLGVKFSIGPASFMQVNDYMRNKLYQKVVELVPENSNVVEGYCGAGLLTNVLSKKCSHITGVEIVEEAIKIAKKVSLNNSITNTDFICGACEDVIPDLVKKQENSVVVLDPPRKGLQRNVAEAVLESRPDKIIYVSCSPQTLARDIGILTGTLKYVDGELKKMVENSIDCNENSILPSGYQIEYLSGYDMFSQCKGVETICSLTKI